MVLVHTDPALEGSNHQGWRHAFVAAPSGLG